MKLIRRNQDSGYLDTWLWVPKKFINVEGTKKALSFIFVDEYSNTGTKVLYLWKESEQHLLVPRSFWRTTELPFDVVDCRPMVYSAAKIQSRIKLDHRWKEIDGQKVLVPTGGNVQQKSLDAMLATQGGVLQLACGKGKTVVALELIAKLGLPAIVIVDNTHLLKQWQGDIEEMLDVPGGVGLIQADKFDWKKPIVMATYQTIASRADALSEEVRRWFGVVVWDEAHHVAAPTFAKSADLFYGRRYGLTATPMREDGLHIIYDFHIGPVLFKDLSQDLKPKMIFKWTGLEVDETDPQVRIRDKNREVHLSKLAVYYGKWRQRLDMILGDIHAAVTSGRRKIMVLSTSVDAAVNLLALWTDPACSQLYTDIPIPAPIEVGETLNPVFLAPKERKRKIRLLASIKEQLSVKGLHPNRMADLQLKEQQLDQLLRQCEVQDKILQELRRRERKYLKELLAKPSTGGLMIHDVSADTRMKFIEEKQIIFGVMKYGREGLDCPELDTVLVYDPFSSKNALQQLMGRPSRETYWDKFPIVMFYEDNVGQIIGMCKKLKKHLKNWPHEEGGPYEYELIGYPHQAGKKWKTTEQGQIFGQVVGQQ